MLPDFLATRRWFPSAQPQYQRALETIIPVDELDIALIEDQGRRKDRYVMPLAIKWQADREHRDPNALAAVQRRPREGMLLDTAADPDLFALPTGCVAAPHRAGAAGGFSPVGTLSVPDKIENYARSTLSNQHPFWSVPIAWSLFTGWNPLRPRDQVGRFSLRLPFITCLMLGAAELVEDRARRAVAVVHRFIENQGDAWLSPTLVSIVTWKRAAAFNRTDRDR